MCVYGVIPRATTKKPLQHSIVEITVDIVKWNFKKCSNNSQESEKGETRRKNRSKKETNAAIGLNQNVPTIILNGNYLAYRLKDRTWNGE